MMTTDTLNPDETPQNQNGRYLSAAIRGGFWGAARIIAERGHFDPLPVVITETICAPQRDFRTSVLRLASTEPQDKHMAVDAPIMSLVVIEPDEKTRGDYNAVVGHVVKKMRKGQDERHILELAVCLADPTRPMPHFLGKEFNESRRRNPAFLSAYNAAKP